ncbi:MAG: hypothetical protein IJX85_06520 [Lachnospiraceae bacterium]|nr:hypothetical protein [Lachnospiraceae bacterium]MBQ8317974.1 hypothetical protein [Lachnospiraceae bacterium]
MRKRLLIIMMISLLALSACGKSEEGKGTEANQTSTEVTTQATEATTEATSEMTTESATTAEATTEAIDYSDRLVAYELTETDNPYVNELLNMSGEYTDSVDNTGTYHYQIPQFNATSDSAKALNQRIEADLYKIVENEIINMDGGFSLICYSLTYEIFQYGDIVAIVATAPYPNDCKYYYAYTYDFENDKEVTNTELLAMNNMTADGFVEEACRMEEGHFMSMANSVGITEPEEIEFYLEPAREDTTADLPMYLDENGVLNVYVPFPSVAGASYYYTLCEF